MTQVRKDVLNGWKEIAAYLGRDPRTVERWEKNRALPVRRLPGSGRATVYALVPELDAWLAHPMHRRGSPEPAPMDAQVENHYSETAPCERNRESLPPGRAVSGDGKYRQFSPRNHHLAVSVVALVLVLSAAYAMVLWSGARQTPTLQGENPARALVTTSRVAGVDELYLRGSYQTELRTPESLRRAQDAFSQAIAKDPRYAPAFAGLASTYVLLREYSTVPDAEAYERASMAAQKAISLDPNLPQAHAVLGFVQFFWAWDANAAQKQFQTALELKPDLPLAHHWYGSMLTHQGRFHEGLRELDLAQKLDPSSPAILTIRALALGLSGQRTESSDLLNDAISTEKAGFHQNPSTMHQVMGLVNLMPPRNIPRFLSETVLAADLRKDASTVKAFQRAVDVYRAQGEQAMWRELLQQERRNHLEGNPTYPMARYEAQLGFKDLALTHLSKLYSLHDTALIGISIDPLFSDLRDDVRFKRLRASMGLPNIDTR